jgi:hypothetical protein
MTDYGTGKMNLINFYGSSIINPFFKACYWSLKIAMAVAMRLKPNFR